MNFSVPDFLSVLIQRDCDRLIKPITVKQIKKDSPNEESSSSIGL